MAPRCCLYCEFVCGILCEGVHLDCRNARLQLAGVDADKSALIIMQVSDVIELADAEQLRAVAIAGEELGLEKCKMT